MHAVTYTIEVARHLHAVALLTVTDYWLTIKAICGISRTE